MWCYFSQFLLDNKVIWKRVGARSKMIYSSYGDHIYKTRTMNKRQFLWYLMILKMLDFDVTMCWACFILMWQFVEHALFSYFLTKCCIIRYAFLCWGKVFHTWTESPLHPLCICLAREQVSGTPHSPLLQGLAIVFSCCCKGTPDTCFLMLWQIVSYLDKLSNAVF